MSQNLIMVDHADKDCRSIFAMLHGVDDGRALAWHSFEDAHPNISQEELMEKFSMEARYGRIRIKNKYSCLSKINEIKRLTMNFVSVATKKKAIPTMAALLVLPALLDGHWIFSSLVGWFAYILTKQPSESVSISNQSIEINDDYVYDGEDYKPTAVAFNQTSSSGSAIWTDYDEHIHNL